MLVKIQDIAEDICEDIGDTTQKYFTTILKKCLLGYSDLYKFVVPIIERKSEILPCSRVIQLPTDFIYETKVGIMRGDYIATLFLDKELRKSDVPTVNMTEANRLINEYLLGIYVDGCERTQFINTYRGNQFVGELYGLGNGFNRLGYYNIDRTDKTIITSIGFLPKDIEIIVEYKSDGIPDGLKMIPSECRQAVNYYAKQEWYADKNPTLSAVNEVRYRTEYTRLKGLYNARSIEFLGEVFVENHKSSPK